MTTPTGRGSIRAED